MKNISASMTFLPKLLAARGFEYRYKEIIAKAKKGEYNEFKYIQMHPKSDMDPKVMLVNDLKKFPELRDVVRMVVKGVFDDEPDESDLNFLKQKMLTDRMTAEDRKVFGL